MKLPNLYRVDGLSAIYVEDHHILSYGDSVTKVEVRPEDAQLAIDAVTNWEDQDEANLYRRVSPLPHDPPLSDCLKCLREYG